MTNDNPATKAPKLQRFSGAKSKIKISSWIALFEVICNKMKVTTDSDKVILLMEYLEEEALQWFADEIATNLDTIKWDETVEAIKKRFGDRTIDPVLAAQRRRLQKTETVQAYFEDKMYHLRKTGLQESSMAEMLTDGMPPHYRIPLIAATIFNTSDWLSKAVRLESSFGTYKPMNQDTNQQRPITVNMVEDKKGKKSKKQPSEPCRYCKKQNKTEYHWHADCPIWPPRQTPTQNENGPLAGNHEVIATVQKN